MAPDRPVAATLSARERSQWMLSRLVPDRGICNLGFAIRVKEQLRWWPLQQALNHLLCRHPTLRTVPQVDGPVIRKRLLAAATDLPLTTEAATERDLSVVLAALVSRPFSSPGEPLFRAHLVPLPDTSVVCLVFHELVVDRAAARGLCDELLLLYEALATGGNLPPELAEVAEGASDPPFDQASIEYWVDHLAGLDLASLPLAGAGSGSGAPALAGARLTRRLSDECLAAVDELQQLTGLTRGMVLLSAFYLLLARHGAGPDLVVGVPVDRREGPFSPPVGSHTDTLPVRVTVDDSRRVRELLDRTRHALVSGMAHGPAAFEAADSPRAPRSGDWRVPLFRHLFAYLPPEKGTSTLSGQSADIFEVANGTSRLDLEWRIVERPESIEIAAGYHTGVHDDEFVHRLLERYDAVVVDLLRALDRPVGTVSAQTSADRAALQRLNATGRRFPDRSLLGEVRTRAAATPDAPALRAEGRTTTYAALVAAAEVVRRTLVEHGVRPGEPVAVCAARCPELAAAVFGVWAAGGMYLPLDPAHPDLRLAEQLDDAGVRLVLSDVSPEAALHGAGERRWLGLADVCRDVPTAAQPWPDPQPAAPAYLIYTSGSTGRPKGVEVSHGNLNNLVRDFAERLAAGPGDRTLWLTTFAFDISALELLLPLATGGTVVVASDADRMHPGQLLDLLVAEGVSIVQATPTTWRHVADRLEGQLRGRTVLSGGEPLAGVLAQRLLAEECRLFNVYGPTETTIWSTVAELTEPVTDPVQIGVPIANTAVHVLGPGGWPVPPGVPGELAVAGSGVAIGYRDRPELTAERFVDDPRIGRYYRTGDQVQLTASGLIFLGRMDRQVKVRGHRVELAEVEAMLESHPWVHAAAVVTEPDRTGQVRLVAAVVPEDGQPAAVDLRELLAHRLPEAALPSRFVWLPALPLTANGKVDHRAVAALTARAGESAQLPSDPMQRTLTTLWRTVLDDDRLGAEANFFLSGGHSLLALELAERITEELGIKVGFDAIFEAPSPERLADRLAAAGAAGAAGAPGWPTRVDAHE